MAHEYSKFKNKNIPYAKVGRRVFNSLFALYMEIKHPELQDIPTRTIGDPCEGCANINRPWNDSVCGHCSRLNDQRYDAYQKKG